MCAQDLCISVFDSRSSFLIRHGKFIIFYHFFVTSFLFYSVRNETRVSFVPTEKKRFLKINFLLLIETVSLTNVLTNGSNFRWKRKNNDFFPDSMKSFIEISFRSIFFHFCFRNRNRANLPSEPIPSKSHLHLKTGQKFEFDSLPIFLLHMFAVSNF